MSLPAVFSRNTLASYWIPLTIIYRKAFYGAVFPSWEWRSAYSESTEDHKKVQHYSFAEPKGESTIDAQPYNIAECVSRVGLGGGIVPMPKGYTPTEQAMGSGMTVYYMADSLETVSLDFRILCAIFILSRARQADHNRWRRESTNTAVLPV